MTKIRISVDSDQLKSVRIVSDTALLGAHHICPQKITIKPGESAIVNLQNWYWLEIIENEEI